MERGRVKKEKGKEMEKEKMRERGKEEKEKRKEVEKEKIKEKEKGKEKGKAEASKRKDKEEEKMKEQWKEGENGKQENEDESTLTKTFLQPPPCHLKTSQQRLLRIKSRFLTIAHSRDGSNTDEDEGSGEEAKNKLILVLGLDGAGKTSILYSLATNRVQHSVAPTQGFNAVCINTEDRKMEFLEIGGSEPFRSYWEKYLSMGLLLIFVVDSADHNRLPEAKKYLHQLIEANPVLPLVVFAHKQDLEAAYHITDIHDALALSEVGHDRKLFLFGTQVSKSGSEMPSTMQDAKDLIAHLAASVQ